ncbi:hypothetical protein [Hymenobacter sp. 102]|uniref:hypothetical protein n=1 Tax=Hymenobacter sp. 102 TaxID=3403152 RepID=UPI003CF42D72
MSIVPSLATAQRYQLQGEPVRTGKIHYFPDGTRNVIVDTGSAKQLILAPEQISWFEQGSSRFEPVSNFTVRFKRESIHIAHDFAILKDTGDIALFIYYLFTSPGRSTTSFLLRKRGETNFVVIHDNSSHYDHGTFSSRDQKLLLKVFGNNSNLRQLLTQQQLTCRNFPAYVHSYNQQVSHPR